MAVAAFFLGHWLSSVFFQSLFHHRYAAHRMFTMSPLWERIFYFGAYLAQGASFLDPRGYAILHRQHHAFSDTRRDPHSPHFHSSLWSMMWATKHEYDRYAHKGEQPEARFLGGLPSWPALDRIGQSWMSRLAWIAIYVGFYATFATAWWQYLLLPAHFVMGPTHGAIVNWCGHRYGYRNFATNDRSRNALVIDFVTGGELYQNNHHQFPMSPDFAFRKFELDTTFLAIRGLSALGVIEMSPHVQRMRDTNREGRQASAVTAATDASGLGSTDAVTDPA